MTEIKEGERLPVGSVMPREEGVWSLSDPGMGDEIKLESTDLFSALIEAIDKMGMRIVKKMKGAAH